MVKMLHRTDPCSRAWSAPPQVAHTEAGHACDVHSELSLPFGRHFDEHSEEDFRHNSREFSLRSKCRNRPPHAIDH